VADGQQRTKRLLGDAELERSDVVANCLMNRERQLAGVNSYARELGFNPLTVLLSRVAGQPPGTAAGWLDLCCGSGRALIQAAEQVGAAGLPRQAILVGVDLAGVFDPIPAFAADNVRLVSASVTSWQPDRTFDVITCVHGLHYVGDKLAVLTRAASWLTPGGLLAADLDLRSIMLSGGQAAARRLATRLGTAGFSYNGRRRQISRTGPATIRLPYAYLGADDRAGPGYTGQPAVNSHYAELC
jgi:SAM-dependent methyltransferase